MAKPARIDGFIAVRMPGDVRRRLDSASEALRGAGVTGEWQQAGTHHLTLKYVGEIGAGEFDAIAEALREPCAGLSLPEFTVGPLFTFDNQEGQTILAARVEPKDDLQRLARVVERAAVACGAPESEFRSFKPHVTLCYMDEDGAEAWRRAKPDVGIPESFGTVDIASVPLNESVGDGQDFRIRRLVKVGWPTPDRYHRASRLIGGAAPAQAPPGWEPRYGPSRQAPAQAPAQAPEPTCAGCGDQGTVETDGKWYCNDCNPERCSSCGDHGTVEIDGEWYCNECEPECCSKCEEPIPSGKERECSGDTLCESCYDELCAACAACGEVDYAEDMVLALGEHYDPQCAPPKCESCGAYLGDDDIFVVGGQPHCEECSNAEIELLTEDLWTDFYRDNPDLESMDALQRAADGDEIMGPGVYVRIFRGLDWEDQYGGEAWARIAETWRDLEEVVRREDWREMYLLVDHAFDLVHNTGPLFTKADPGIKAWLFKALEDKYFLDPLQYRGKLSPDARKLLDAHIRYSGGMAEWKERMTGLEKAMDRFTDAYRQMDGKMAARVWDVFGLTAWMFRRREDFVDAAFWAMDKNADRSPDAARLRLFLSRPTRKRFLEALDVIRPDMCLPGSDQPIASVAREGFLPRALKLLSKDKKLREHLHNPPSSVSFLPRQTLERWGQFFESYGRRQKEEEEASSGVSAALAAGFLRLALSPEDFYDFYALSAVDCRRLPDDLARMCEGLKKVTMLAVAKALLPILSQAVVDEATHVDRHLAHD